MSTENGFDLDSDILEKVGDNLVFIFGDKQSLVTF